jgi:DNA-binding NtrC family response regulator
MNIVFLSGYGMIRELVAAVLAAEQHQMRVYAIEDLAKAKAEFQPNVDWIVIDLQYDSNGPILAWMEVMLVAYPTVRAVILSDHDVTRRMHESPVRGRMRWLEKPFTHRALLDAFDTQAGTSKWEI